MSVQEKFNILLDIKNLKKIMNLQDAKLQKKI
jgi:hypothetical protein